MPGVIGLALVVLTIGIGYCVVYGTCLADFLVVIAGLILGWIALLYCVGSLMFSSISS